MSCERHRKKQNSGSYYEVSTQNVAQTHRINDIPLKGRKYMHDREYLNGCHFCCVISPPFQHTHTHTFNIIYNFLLSRNALSILLVHTFLYTYVYTSIVLFGSIWIILMQFTEVNVRFFFLLLCFRAS